MAPPAPPKNGEEDQRGLYSFARFTVQNDHYAGFYQTWVGTILFLLGRHWLKWLEAKRRYTTDTDIPPWRQQPVTNVVYAVYRTLATKLSKQKPTLEVVPPSGDSNDRESARLAESILVDLWTRLKKPAKIRRALGWFLCTGQVYFRVSWDPDAGKLVPLTKLVEVPHPDPILAQAGETIDLRVPCDDDGEPILKNQDEESPAKGEDGTGEATTPHLVQGADVPDAMQGSGEQAEQAEGQNHPYDLNAKAALVPEGEINFSFEDPMCVRFNPDATDAEDADEMFVAKLWPIKRAERHFKLKPGTVALGMDDGDRQMYQDLMMSAAAGAGWMASTNFSGAQLGSSQEEALGERALVCEYYHDRDTDYPEGRHWISIGRKKVWPADDDKDYPTGEAPLPNGFWPPLIPALSLPIPGQPQAMGVLSQVRPLNEALNTLNGKIKEHEFTMAMGGKWVKHPADKGLAINADPVQVLTSAGYADNHPPMQVKVNALPAEIYAEREQLMSDIRLVGSLSEISGGKVPQGVTAGRPMLVQQEEVDSVLTPDLESLEMAYEEIGRRELVLAQRHYREERKIAIRGERGEWEVRSFDGSDLVDRLDVRVQVGSSFPWSKAAQWDAKVNMLSKFPGIVQKPDGTVDQERMAEILDVSGSGLEAFETDEDPDLVEVQREHAMFEAYNPAIGEQQLPELGFWQSQPKHLEAHYRFMKMDRARFERWTPEAQAAFLDHCKQTAMAVDELADHMVSATGAGLPGGPPAPAPPQAAPDGGGGPPNLRLERGGQQPPTVAPAAQTPGKISAQEQPVLSPADLASARK